MSTVIRLALADDQALVRSGLKALLTSFDALQVCVEAADGEALLAALEQDKDAAVGELRLRVNQRLEAARAR